MEVKICGITNNEDAQNAIALGADALGFIFVEQSPRYIRPELVQEITLALPPFTTLVGVFQNHETDHINDILEQCGLDLAQLHGSESPEKCLKIKRRVTKAFPIAELDDIYSIAPYQGMISGAVLDTKVGDQTGGTGQAFDWGIALKAKEEFDIPIILAGGINPSNIKKALNLVNPYAIDISSGVESDIGIKDYNLLKEVMHLAKDH